MVRPLGLEHTLSATAKWFTLATDIVLYEVTHASDGELLSEACDRWIARNPVAARLSIVSAGALLTLHLANLIDSRYDPVSPHFWRFLASRVHFKSF